MDSLNLSKYTKKQIKRPPNSPRAEVVEIARLITDKPFKQILGLTRHLQPDQIHFINNESRGKGEFWWAIFQNKYMQNNIFSEVKEKLEKFPQFRERKQRPPFLAKLALRSIKLETEYKNRFLSLEELSQFAIKYATYERNWREVTMKYEHLRGKDYEEKADIENQFINQLRNR